MKNDDQVSRLLTQTEGDEPQLDDGVSPTMPFPTSYVIDRDQETELVDYALNRLDELEKEMGRDVCAGGSWWQTDGMAVGDPEGTDGPQHSWMGKRLLFDKTFKNEMEWRPALLGGIFAHSNLIVPAARRICRQMIARAVNYFFGTSPWFAGYPVGVMDKVRADKADRYTRWKMDQAKLQRTEEQAIERAFIVGEAVVKTTWAQREQIYKTKATVLVDDQGFDILASDGDYILENDLWIQDGAIDDATGEMVYSDLMILKRDGKTPQPPVMKWEEKLITRRIVHYKGPEAKVMNFMDFLCPLDAPTIQEADCCAHLYDMPLMQLADQWKKSIASNSTAEQRVVATRKAMEVLRTLAGGGGQSSSAQNSDIVDSSTRPNTENRLQPVLEIAEVHLTYDIDGDGARDIILVIDRKSRIPIFYDYEANVTADGLRPFSCVRVNEIVGRWYGMGAMEMMNPSQQIIDLWMNRKNRAVSGAGRVDFWSPENTVEGAANADLELNWGGTYTPKGNKTAEDCLKSIYLEDNIGEKLMDLMEFVMQLMMNESGIANANDGNVAGMDSTKLATGIRNVEKSGQELFSLFLGHLDPGISETLVKMVKLLFSRLDEMEVYRYFEEGEAGGEGGQELREIDPGDLANLEIDVQILLSRQRGEQVLESSGQAVSLVEKFYSLAYEVQIVVAPLFRDMLRALQIKEADKIIRPTAVPLAGPTGALQGSSTNVSTTTTTPRQAPPNL
jgi:hypothetical protein